MSYIQPKIDYQDGNILYGSDLNASNEVIKEGVDDNFDRIKGLDESKQNKLIAGTGIEITDDNIINNTQTSAEWGNIQGNIDDQTDLKDILDTKAETSDIPTKLSELENDTDFVDSTALEDKQDILVSGTNIKTINNLSLLGSGNIDIQGGGGGPASWGNISGDIDDQTDLKNALDSKLESSDVSQVALSGEYSDLSGTPTNLSDFTNDTGFVDSTDLATKVDKIEGKGLSTNDLTNELKSNYDDAYNKRHEHSNKAILDNISSSDITNWNNKPNKRETIPLFGGNITYNSVSGDLNSPEYLKIGSYSGNGLNCINCPTDSVFKMEVYAILDNVIEDKESITSKDTYRLRKITDIEGNEYVQYVSPGASYTSPVLYDYGAWIRKLDNNDLEVAISSTEPTGSEEIWIDPTEPLNNVGTEVVNNLNGNEVNKAPSVNAIKSLLNTIFPIGKVEVFFDNNNHSNYMGFTWVRTSAGKVPVNIDTSQTEFNTIGKTGGSKYLQEHYHTLGISQNVIAGANSYGLDGSQTAQATFNTKTAGTGNSGNLQPYEVMAFWKRVS